MVNALKAMYSSVKSAIKFNDEISANIDSLTGVKQGDSNSSLLFTMFVNDILNNINYNLDCVFTIEQLRLFLLLFADDQALFATSASSLQSMLNEIEYYCNKWKMKININKGTAKRVHSLGIHSPIVYQVWLRSVEGCSL